MMRRLLIFIMLVAMGFASGVGCPDSILNTASVCAVIDSVFDEALHLIGLERYELGFEKKYGELDSFRLEDIVRMMDDPLYIPVFSDSMAHLAETSGQRIAPMTIFAGEVLDKSVELPREYSPPQQLLDKYQGLVSGHGIPDSLSDVIGFFLSACDSASRLCELVYDAIPEDVRLSILRDAAELWLSQSADPDSLALEYLFHEFAPELVDSIDEVSYRRLLETMETLDYQTLYTAFTIYALAWDSLYSFFTDTLWDTEGIEDTTISARRRAFPEIEGDLEIEGIQGGVIADIESPIGRIIIGGSGDNVYRIDAPFIIDIGGDDIYLNRASCAIGYLGHFVTALIDFGGNDAYISDDWFFAQGSAVMGIAGLFDIGGNDIYRAGGYSQGSAIIGYAVHFDDDGDNMYRGGEHCQAAGTFGISILHAGTWDSDRQRPNPKSNDDFRAHRYAQGFGSVKSFAMLRNMGGNDTYTAGGKYLHEPLHPEYHQSMSQGFGFGWRGRASGGIGFLYDAVGNDNYSTQIYGQGSSYWYGFGLLYDVTGHDTYLLEHYGQGAGIHLSVGALIDRIGNDAYYGRRGPSQGCAHDWAVGFFFDGGGDDYFAADGVAWGQGHTNSVGIFISKSGNDVYGGKSAHHLQGTASSARGYGGLGIFLDLGGDDRYIRGQGRNNAHWVKGFYGVGIDAEIFGGEAR